MKFPGGFSERLCNSAKHYDGWALRRDGDVGLWDWQEVRELAKARFRPCETAATAGSGCGFHPTGAVVHQFEASQSQFQANVRLVVMDPSDSLCERGKRRLGEMIYISSLTSRLPVEASVIFGGRNQTPLQALV